MEISYPENIVEHPEPIIDHREHIAAVESPAHISVNISADFQQTESGERFHWSNVR